MTKKVAVILLALLLAPLLALAQVELKGTVVKVDKAKKQIVVKTDKGEETLEITSGTGQHAVHFARGLPDLTWQPSDPDAGARASIAAWSAEAVLPNLMPPLDIDATAGAFGMSGLAGVVAINMLHIAPWLAVEGLMAGAGRALMPAGRLILYGPYKRAGRHTAPSNAAFDGELRRQDAAWGVRDLEAVLALAEASGLTLDRPVEMPANNLSVVLRRTA